MSSLLPIHENYSQTLLSAHWAVQIPAAASSLIEKKSDWSHTNLVVEDGVLRGRALPDGRRVEIDLANYLIRLGDKEFSLEGETLSSGLAWLSDMLGAKLQRLDHELPSRSESEPFSRSGAESQVQSWFDLAQTHLSKIAASECGGEVRVWPHHFDIATLIEIDQGGEEARSVNVGLSPGDSSYSDPYWYVTPWPKPSDVSQASLSTGKWHTEGFTAAVLRASQIDAPTIETQVASFLKGAVEVSKKLLE